MRVHPTGLLALGMVILGIYLFVSAPPPLPSEQEGRLSAQIPIDRVMATIAAENDAVRTLYTREIVGKGQTAGLAFDEFWRKEEVLAGPLPALFLREAAGSVQRTDVPLGLFLGSDYPISSANRFQGEQATVFEKVKETREAVIFFDDASQMHTAMFPDLASAQPCVSCHNEHAESPKTDWVMNDVMGATTWTYPRGSVTMEEYLEIVATVRAGFRYAYSEYLVEAAAFTDPPEIGEQWPSDGYFLPSADVFMEEFAQRASAPSIERILSSREF